jgi:hypothetical protein
LPRLQHEPDCSLEVVRRPKEYAYDRHTQFGYLGKALDAAASNQWMMVDMKKDWKRIFTFE